MNCEFSPSVINRIEIFSRTIVFANPPSRSAKLTIINLDGRFVRQQALVSTSDELSESVVLQVLQALDRPAISCLDATLFDMPPAVIDRHYGSVWSGDYPSLVIRIIFKDDRQMTIRSNAQYEFMLPLKIAYSAMDAPFETYDPELSRALARLMPSEFLNAERLAGRSGLLELDHQFVESEEIKTIALAEPATKLLELSVEDLNGDDAKPTTGFDEVEEIIFEMWAGEESNEEVQNAEQSGQLSDRLLKRNSLETVQDLLARGANVSIEDSMGQSALMHAALPPFNRGRFCALVEAGADLEARRYDGLTGLLLACAGGEAEAVAEWVRAGADISAQAPDGATPLMLGASWPRVVRTLLDAGADVNAVDHIGHVPIVYAITHQCSINEGEQLDVLQTMINAGADVNLRDHTEITPLGHAIRMLAVQLLEEEVASVTNPEMKGTLDERRKLAEAVVALLISSGAIE